MRFSEAHAFFICSAAPDGAQAGELRLFSATRIALEIFADAGRAPPRRNPLVFQRYDHRRLALAGQIQSCHMIKIGAQGAPNPGDDMPFADVNGLKIAYDERGPAAAPAILLIMGLGTQMLAWSDPFCDSLAAGGFRVVRFDNRDIGLSSKIEGGSTPNIRWAFTKALLGLSVHGPYTLDDMAGDAIGLMDALGIDRAHVVGASMGGMIAQILAASRRTRVRSLVSIMSTTGDRHVGQATTEAREAVLAPRPDASDREAAIRHAMGIQRVIGSPGCLRPSEEALRTRVEAACSRSYYPEGVPRQLLAILGDGSRVKRLNTIDVPTLVIHGDADPLVPLSGGQHTAANIRNAALKIIPGMGHDLPLELVPLLTKLIIDHCDAADAGCSTATEPRAAMAARG
jgi:pimeloyl-ACP methyl ester carboxylesterase